MSNNDYNVKLKVKTKRGEDIGYLSFKDNREHLLSLSNNPDEICYFRKIESTVNTGYFTWVFKPYSGADTEYAVDCHFGAAKDKRRMFGNTSIAAAPAWKIMDADGRKNLFHAAPLSSAPKSRLGHANEDVKHIDKIELIGALNGGYSVYEEQVSADEKAAREKLLSLEA
ncbi:hypothetical protein NMR54_003687 [Vibrio cholerae]|nr:hypothetical protein [Vibrio cholerae]EGQ9334199.1 hypothetical protein [Vibrio cholerae]EIA3093276.1 hypothetical protein [Vibrio cholerae]EJL6322205.1 hypothetical protein [Vibrio cholerae]EJL6706465.1 hypothetical protein [Vibrio cholerae]